MKVSYIRVSTIEQNIEIHKTENKMYIDKCSGSIPFIERTSAKKLLSDIEKGLITEIEVSSIDRLGRNLVDTIKTIELFTSKGVMFSSRRECLYSHIDNKPNPTFNLMVGLLGSVAQFELQRLKERRLEGIATAKAQGKFLGRSFGSSETEDTFINKEKNNKALQLLKKGLSLNEVMYKTKLSKPTIIKIKRLYL